MPYLTLYAVGLPMIIVVLFVPRSEYKDENEFTVTEKIAVCLFWPLAALIAAGIGVAKLIDRAFEARR